MVEDSQTRGFLFADIRGYTEYMERHGATATAELLARYRAIVRATIAEHRGAEIRTEGDSFYVVLPTASAAVRCALAIVERVDSDNASHEGDAIRVGIGVHAGEAIQTDEGLVGSAINIAARLSALARPGEVLMSDTVRALTRSMIPVRYIPRGRHRLKGVAEPQEVFAAVPADGAVVQAGPRWQSPPRSVFLAAIAVALVVIVGYATVGGGFKPDVVATSSPTAGSSGVAAASASATAKPTNATVAPTRTPTPTSSGPTTIHIEPGINPISGGYRLLPPGDYRFDSFRPVVEFAIEPTWTDRGWWPRLAAPDFSSLFALRAGVDTGAPYPWEGVRRGQLILNFIRLQTVSGDPCNPGATGSYELLLGGRPRDVIDWLKNHPFLETTNLHVIPIAGRDALSIDVTLKADPDQECAASTGSVGLFTTTQIAGNMGGSSVGGPQLIREGETHRITVIDVGGDAPLVFVAQCRVSDCPALLPWADDFIDSITLD